MHGFWMAALIGLTVVLALRARRYRRMLWRYGIAAGPCGRRAWGGGVAPHPFDDEPVFRRRGRGLLFLFRRLDLSPGQEKAVVKLSETLRAELRRARPELVAARKDLAAAFASEELDAGVLEALFEGHRALLSELTRGLWAALSEVHALLDADQRARLAEMIADGSFHPRWAGMYRGGY